MNRINQGNRANRENRVDYITFLLLAICSLFVFGAGCASVQEYNESRGSSQGQITVVLQGPDKPSNDISFDLEAINILSEDGTYKEIMNTPMDINSILLAGRQIRLGERYLPVGRYKKLQLIVKQPLIKRKDKAANLALPPEGIEINIDVTVRRNQNTSLFLNWNPDASVAEGYLFKPAFTLKSQVPELSSLLVYVTNEASNNVSVINRQTGEIVATILVGQKPKGIATSLGKEHPKVYVANSGSNSISVIDPTFNKVEVEIPVRFGVAPEGIAVASISPDRELIFVANYGSSNISVIDAATYQETRKINVGDGPIAVTTDPPIDSLSTIRFLSFDDINILRRFREKFFNVYVANKNSRDVSVIRMDMARNTPDDVTNIPVDWSPITLAVDYQRGKVYVGNYNYDNLSVIDILRIIKGNKAGAVSSVTNIGPSVVGIISDPEFDRIYLLKEFSGEILVIRPFSEAFGSIRATMSPIMGTITVGKSPRSIVLDPEDRKMYVVNRGSDTVSVVDKTTRREEQVIPVGKNPYGIAMFPF